MAGRGRGNALKEAIAKVRISEDQAIEARVRNEGSLCLPVLEQDDWHGSKGNPERLVANYIRLEKSSETANGIHEYLLEFSPAIDNLQDRFKCLYQHKDTIGQFNVFDGRRLHLPHRLPVVSLAL